MRFAVLYLSVYVLLSAGRPLFAELSPVTDFREACCRQNDMGECNRGGFCNFMSVSLTLFFPFSHAMRAPNTNIFIRSRHLKEPRSSLVRELHAQQRVERRLNPSARDQERAREMAEFSLAPTKDRQMADPSDFEPEHADDRRRNGRHRGSHHD